MEKIAGSNKMRVGQMNRVAVMRTLQSRPRPFTVAEIAHLTQLTSATVANILSNLLGESLVVESGIAESTGGRKPALYSLNPHAGLVAGIEIEVERLVCVLLDFTGSIVAQRVQNYDFRRGPHYVVSLLKESVMELMISAGYAPNALSSVGLALPGPIDFEQGVLLNPFNMPGWVNVPLRDMLAFEFEVSCLVENDANAAGFGEMKCREDREDSSVVYIMVDVGVGSGILINGQIYRGVEGGGSAIGHTIIQPHGPLCNCGNHGCVEAVASGAAIQRVAKEWGFDMPLEQLLGDIGVQDSRLNDFITECGDLLGMAIGNVCNLFAPEMVIIGGVVASLSTSFYDRAVEMARSCAMSRFSNRITFQKARLGDYSSSIGVGLLSRDKLFDTIVD